MTMKHSTSLHDVSRSLQQNARLIGIEDKLNDANDRLTAIEASLEGMRDHGAKLDRIMATLAALAASAAPPHRGQTYNHHSDSNRVHTLSVAGVAEEGGGGGGGAESARPSRTPSPGGSGGGGGAPPSRRKLPQRGSMMRRISMRSLSGTSFIRSSRASVEEVDLDGTLIDGGGNGGNGENGGGSGTEAALDPNREEPPETPPMGLRHAALAQRQPPESSAEGGGGGGGGGGAGGRASFVDKWVIGGKPSSFKENSAGGLTTLPVRGDWGGGGGGGGGTGGGGAVEGSDRGSGGGGGVRASFGWARPRWASSEVVADPNSSSMWHTDSGHSGHSGHSGRIDTGGPTGGHESQYGSRRSAATPHSGAAHGGIHGGDFGGGGDFRDGLVPSGVLRNGSSAGMLNPRAGVRMAWDLAVVLPLLVYLTVVLPFRLTFQNEPVPFSGVYWWEFLIDMLFIADIVLNFRTGVPVHVDNAEIGEPHEVIEYDRGLVAKDYLRSWFIPDVVSGIPFALIELILTAGGGQGGAEKFKSAKALKLMRFLKLGRLLKLDKILKNLDRDTLDTIEDFMQSGSTRSFVVMAKLVLIMTYACHLMGCGFVLVGRAGYSAGSPNWFEAETNVPQGPFTMQDTERGSNVYAVYVAAFYFAVTTMTSVGYGDIITHNNYERMYVIFLEFCSAIVFATVIAAITSVVTSMDMNARKTAEQLDAVASFVEVRQFPYDMARRIRRHFRHYYSLKSAIDETKIFSELSSTLRREVSEYLIRDIIGNGSIFMTMPPNLWPRLLPLLRPMRFEQGEVVGEEHEECTEMYVVLKGCLAAGTRVRETVESPGNTFEQTRGATLDLKVDVAAFGEGGGGGPLSPGGGANPTAAASRAARVRLLMNTMGSFSVPNHPLQNDDDDDDGEGGDGDGPIQLEKERLVTTGGNVNILHALGIWDECVETVLAKLATDTYAVSGPDFQGLFNTNMDKRAFERMQRRECRRYEMDPKHPGAPSKFGKPLRRKEEPAIKGGLGNSRREYRKRGALVRVLE